MRYVTNDLHGHEQEERECDLYARENFALREIN